MIPHYCILLLLAIFVFDLTVLCHFRNWDTKAKAILVVSGFFPSGFIYNKVQDFVAAIVMIEFLFNCC